MSILLGKQDVADCAEAMPAYIGPALPLKDEQRCLHGKTLSAHAYVLLWCFQGGSRCWLVDFCSLAILGAVCFLWNYLPSSVSVLPCQKTYKGSCVQPQGLVCHGIQPPVLPVVFMAVWEAAGCLGLRPPEFDVRDNLRGRTRGPLLQEAPVSFNVPTSSQKVTNSS